MVFWGNFKLPGIDPCCGGSWIVVFCLNCWWVVVGIERIAVDVIVVVGVLRLICLRLFLLLFGRLSCRLLGLVDWPCFFQRAILLIVYCIVLVFFVGNCFLALVAGFSGLSFLLILGCFFEGFFENEGNLWEFCCFFLEFCMGLRNFLLYYLINWLIDWKMVISN